MAVDIDVMWSSGAHAGKHSSRPAIRTQPCERPYFGSRGPPHLAVWYNFPILAGGRGRALDSQRATSLQPPDLGASPFGNRPQPPLRCDLFLNRADRAASASAARP